MSTKPRDVQEAVVLFGVWACAQTSFTRRVGVHINDYVKERYFTKGVGFSKLDVGVQGIEFLNGCVELRQRAPKEALYVINKSLNMTTRPHDFTATCDPTTRQPRQ